MGTAALIAVASASLAAAAAMGTASGVPAQSLRQLTSAELRPLVVTTSQAQLATGFVGTLSPGTPTAFKCGVQPDSHANFCSRIWDSSSPSAHPTISTVASFTSAGAARAQIRAESGRGADAGTIVEKSAVRLVYYVTGLPGVGTAAIAQQAIGSTYAYAWCSSAATEPTGPAVKCAQDLLAAQVARVRSH